VSSYVRAKYGGLNVGRWEGSEARDGEKKGGRAAGGIDDVHTLVQTRAPAHPRNSQIEKRAHSRLFDPSLLATPTPLLTPSLTPAGEGEDDAGHGGA